jgi:hypothetical protein
MLVYHFDPETLVYANFASEADEDPLERGKFLLPADSTPLIPPSPPNPKKQHAVFRDGDWVIEDIPQTPTLKKNLKEAPKSGMWPRLSIKEALKGGVT